MSISRDNFPSPHAVGRGRGPSRSDGRVRCASAGTARARHRPPPHPTLSAPEGGEGYWRVAILVALILTTAVPAQAADRSAVTPALPGQPYFVQLAPIFVPVIGKNDIARQVSLAVAVEIADGAEAKTAEEKRPFLDHAFLTDVYRYVQQRGGIGELQGELALKERLRQTAQQILDPVAVKEVEIEVFFQQQR
jgi:hypothetical protein